MVGHRLDGPGTVRAFERRPYEMPVGVSREAAVGSGPDRSTSVGVKRSDSAAWQPLLLSEPHRPPIRESRDAIVVRDPGAAIARDRNPAVLGSHVVYQRHETRCKTSNSAIGGDPDVAFSILQDGHDIIAGQSLLRGEPA